MNYKEMKLEEIANYINCELGKGRNFTEIAHKDFECNESTLRKKLTGKKLYKRIGNVYVRTDLNSEIDNVRQDGRHNVTETDISIAKQQEVELKASNEKYIELINNYELIMQMLDDYKRSKERGQQFTGLVVELPVEKKKDFRVTLRLNDVVYEEFKEFADKNKQFTLKELISQALKEFVKKYK